MTGPFLAIIRLALIESVNINGTDNWAIVLNCVVSGYITLCQRLHFGRLGVAWPTLGHALMFSSRVGVCYQIATLLLASYLPSTSLARHRA